MLAIGMVLINVFNIMKRRRKGENRIAEEGSGGSVSFHSEESKCNHCSITSCCSGSDEDVQSPSRYRPVEKSLTSQGAVQRLASSDTTMVAPIDDKVVGMDGCEGVESREGASGAMLNKYDNRKCSVYLWINKV